jgi:cellulose synthase/poly-beta-1,6-N-acetylglucosamine synthase-like glycosyltransferase
MEWLEAVAWVVVVLLIIPLAVLMLECLVALKRWRPATQPNPDKPPRCVILIPAHDEETIIARTLSALAPQVGPGDRVVVIADNCKDATAEIARSHGAEVLERTDHERRGKGFALAFGRDYLKANPPDIVVVLDADCTAREGAVQRLTHQAHVRQRPAQGNYLMTAPAQAGPDRRVAAFAFLVKNLIRPLGLCRLGQPCTLTGTGMAFPWHVFQDAALGDGHIVEDLSLTVDLALSRRSPIFVPEAEFRGEFPIDERTAESQRRRWEHGHLRVICSDIPRLLLAALVRARLRLLFMAVDIGVPPLSALVLLVAGVLVVLGTWAVLGGPIAPVAALAVVGLGASLSLAAVWKQYGQDTLPAKVLIRIPFYALKKISLYFQFLIKPQRKWVRTSRDQQPQSP